VEGETRIWLVCVECEAVGPAGALGWKALLTDDEPADVAIYCPDCASRELS
jgi:hypothetical protein